MGVSTRLTVAVFATLVLFCHVTVGLDSAFEGLPEDQQHIVSQEADPFINPYSRFPGGTLVASNMKDRWPELVGKSSEEAKEAVLKDAPEVKVYIVPFDSMVTMDYQINRVRIFVDPQQRVVQIPVRG